MPQSNTPTAFWRVFESFPAQSAPAMEWRQRLGGDHPRFQALLKPTGETAGAVLIDGQPHRVVVHATDRVVAVPEEGGPAVALGDGDALIVRLHVRLLRSRLAAAFGLIEASAPGSIRDPGRNLGRWTVSPERSVMAHLVLECDPDDRSAAVRRLLTDHDGPLLILTPTRLFDAELEMAIRTRTSCSVVLEEAVAVDERGGFALCREAEAQLERFRASVEALDHGQGRRSVYRLAREGSVWVVAFGGHECRIPHREASGLAYIQHMLTRPGKAVEVVDLETSVSGDERISAASIGDDVIDKQGLQNMRNEFSRHTADRDRAKANGDAAAEAAALESLRELAQRLHPARGLNGKVRRQGDDVERLRKKVCESINRARRKLEKAGCPLAGHLNSSLQLGRTLTYQPGVELPWTFC